MDISDLQRESSYIKEINDNGEEKDLDKLLTEEELLKKLNELKRLKEEDSDEDLGQVLTGEKSEDRSSEEDPILLRTNQRL